MATRFDDFFEYLTGPDFVNSDSGRFEYRLGTILKDVTRNKDTDPSWDRLPDGEKYRMVPFKYKDTAGNWHEGTRPDARITLIDTVREKSYIAHDPTNLGPKFFLSALIVPLSLVVSIAVQVAKLTATIFINIAYQTFSDVYEEIDNEDLLSLFLQSFEKHVEKNKSEFFQTVERIFNGCKYAAGLELAACYGAFYYDDIETSCKMQTIYAEIERKWNEGVHYKQTPVAYGMRFAELYDQGLTVQQCVDRLEPEKLKPTFYILECCQERNMERLDLLKETYPSYEAVRDALDAMK